MATIETANLAGMKTKHCNVSDLVGIGEKNEINDVMVVQALFKLIGRSDFLAKKYFRLAPTDLPEATGNFDKKTIKAIWAFQQTMKLRLLNVDGKIHPASYKDRNIQNAFNGRLMAITLLNMHAYDESVIVGADDVPDAVKQLAPAIMFT